MIQKAIGQTFGDEIIAAGLRGKPFSWVPDGTLHFDASMTQADIDAVRAVYNSHDPAKLDPRAVFSDRVAAGVVITSTATPTLSATYAIDAAAEQNISGIAAGIATRNRVPGGGSTFNYGDIAGVPHAFSAADFLNFAAAVEDYRYGLSQALRVLAAGGSVEWPSPNVTIA